MTEPELFHLDPSPALPAIDPTLSAGQRLTLRQKGQIANGWHPFGMALHPDAPTDPDPSDRGRGFTCGSCAFRVSVRHHDGTYPKCEKHGFAASAASDCRAWWPACKLYEPKVS